MFLHGSCCQLDWQVKEEREEKWRLIEPPKEEVRLQGLLSYGINTERTPALSVSFTLAKEGNKFYTKYLSNPVIASLFLIFK